MPDRGRTELSVRSGVHGILIVVLAAAVLAAAGWLLSMAMSLFAA